MDDKDGVEEREDLVDKEDKDNVLDVGQTGVVQVGLKNLDRGVVGETGCDRHVVCGCCSWLGLRRRRRGKRCNEWQGT